MNGVSMFEKEREGGGGGGGAICLRVKDWIICGLAERQLVCFVLEHRRNKEEEPPLKKKKKTLKVFGFAVKYIDGLLQCDCSQNGRRGVFETDEETVHRALCWLDLEIILKSSK
ncbi:uncharacterized [Tachysurus ichikawai]